MYDYMYDYMMPFWGVFGEGLMHHLKYKYVF